MQEQELLDCMFLFLNNSCFDFEGKIKKLKLTNTSQEQTRLTEFREKIISLIKKGRTGEAIELIENQVAVSSNFKYD